jgi:RNA polymerase sigma-70 factor (ECF subfamily)
MGNGDVDEEQLPVQLSSPHPAPSAAWTTSPGDCHDTELLGRIMAGDSAALELLYDRYAAAVMGLAFKMLGDRTLAEEVTQETFWRVWRSAETFQSRQGKFTSWLFGITRNLCIDSWRRRQVRPQPVADPAAVEPDPGQLPDAGLDVAESAWTAIKHKQVRAALAALPPTQRQVIELAYFWGMTRQEIADQTNVPLGTVHTRARLALQKLREALQEQGFED